MTVGIINNSWKVRFPLHTYPKMLAGMKPAQRRADFPIRRNLLRPCAKFCPFYLKRQTTQHLILADATKQNILQKKDVLSVVGLVFWGRNKTSPKWDLGRDQGSIPRNTDYLELTINLGNSFTHRAQTKTLRLD